MSKNENYDDAWLKFFLYGTGAQSILEHLHSQLKMFYFYLLIVHYFFIFNNHNVWLYRWLASWYYKGEMGTSIICFFSDKQKVANSIKTSFVAGINVLLIKTNIKVGVCISKDTLPIIKYIKGKWRLNCYASWAVLLQRTVCQKSVFM